MKLTYLGCPYSHSEPEVREARVDDATFTAARLAISGESVFSPITHGHEMARYLPIRNLMDHEFWMKQCLPILRVCDQLLVLPLKGWRTSRGLTQEMAIARACMIPINFVDISVLRDRKLDFPSHEELLENNWGLYDVE